MIKHLDPLVRRLASAAGMLSLCLVCLTACISQLPPSSTSTPTRSIEPTLASATKESPPKDLASRWLQGIPCEPPCWEGVVPGQTTASEAVVLLKNSPLILTAEITNSIITGHGIITWQWLNNERGGQASYYTSPITTNEAIYIISLFYPTRFTLREAIQAYGAPSDIIARAYYNPDNSIAYDVSIFYRSWDVVLFGFSSDKIAISLDMTFSRVSFFAPTDEGLRIALGGSASHPEWLVPWQGIRDFEFYCKDLVGGKACRGEP